MKKNALILAMIIMSTMILGGCQKPVEETKPGDDGEVTIITAKEVEAAIGNSEWVIVDTRINDAYNGWALDGVAQGGHIEGATDFAYNWINTEVEGKDAILDTILLEKGITKEKNIILYDANGLDAKVVATYLKGKGYDKLNLYDVKEWAADTTKKMVSYKNYQKIVPASFVKEQMDAMGSDLKIFEVSWGQEAEDYKKGHLKGAVHIDTDEMEIPPIWNRIPDAELTQFALNNGITKDSKVILYGADPTPAYRIAIMLEYLGVNEYYVINGGYDAWVRAGYEVETTVNAKVPATDFGVATPANPNYIVDIAEAKAILEDKTGSVLVDIRSWDEYIGKTPGYSDITVAGRPDGSVWGQDLGYYRNIDKTMKNAYEIEKMWSENGITADKNLSFFCGTGWRAAEVLIFADVMGFEKISLYDGGWYEWIADTTNPILTGEPK